MPLLHDSCICQPASLMHSVLRLDATHSHSALELLTIPTVTGYLSILFLNKSETLRVMGLVLVPVDLTFAPLPSHKVIVPGCS